METMQVTALLKSAYNARRPWLSPDAMFEFVHTIDSQELIDKCCCCNYSECINCIACKSVANRSGRTRKVSGSLLEDFADMIYNKVPQKNICEKLGISRSTYFNYKKEIMKGVMK